MRRHIGEFTGLPIITIGTDESLPIDQCMACLSADIHTFRWQGQNVDYLQPVRGEPYPTLAVHPETRIELRCRNCGNQWGSGHIDNDVRIPDDLIEWDVLSRAQINDPDIFGY